MEDAFVAVNSAGYFNDAANMLSVRYKMIVVETNTLTTNFCEALSNTGYEVDAFYGIAVTETEGD
tara:strand:- start:82 stop:276 length:195 start_codon:yes stop_codon:yes gene_type:complete